MKSSFRHYNAGLDVGDSAVVLDCLSVGRCKLDPSLKAPGFKMSTTYDTKLLST